MEARICAARWLVYDAAFRKQSGLPYSKEAAVAKLFAAETAMDVTTVAVQLHGGYGYSKDYPGGTYDARCKDYGDIRRYIRSAKNGHRSQCAKIRRTS